MASGLLRGRCGAGECGQGCVGGEPAAGIADLDQQLGGADPAGAGHAGEDVAVGCRASCSRICASRARIWACSASSVATQALLACARRRQRRGAARRGRLGTGRAARPGPPDLASLTLALEGQAAKAMVRQAPGVRRQSRNHQRPDGAPVSRSPDPVPQRQGATGVHAGNWSATRSRARAQCPGQPTRRTASRGVEGACASADGARRRGGFHGPTPPKHGAVVAAC